MFWNFINYLPSKIDSVFFTIGNFEIRWYSLSYLVAFITVFFLIFWRIKKGEYSNLLSGCDKSHLKGRQNVENIFLDIFLIAILGLILGARIGYGIFYDFQLILNPWRLFNPWEKGEYVGIYGMSFYGGLAGIILALLVYSKIKKIKLWPWLNFIIPAVPAGYFFGRVGNFLNGELYGRPTDLKIGMHFPLARDNFLHHPSQLYEAFLEGLIIFIILWSLRNRKNWQDRLFPLFLIFYGFFRFLIEFVREEKFYGYFTTGQYLSLGVIIIGVGGMAYFKNKRGF